MTVTLDAESMTFPRELLDSCRSALLLFASGRMGAADGYWVREDGISDVTAVDWDSATLEPFQDVYPASWHYVLADVFEWVQRADRRWDIVSADAPSQVADRLAEMLPRYCDLANRYVVATAAVTGDDELEVPSAPAGWSYLAPPAFRAEFEGRRFWWLTLERDLRVVFDDGPTDLTPAILDALKAARERAVFFVNGKNIAGREHVLRRIVAEGHEVGNHGWSHEPMDAMSDAEVRAEFDRTDDAIVAVTGDMPARLRPPFRRLDRDIDLGRPIELASSLGDYDLSAHAIVQAAVALGPPIYLHELPQTVAALPAILKRLAP